MPTLSLTFSSQHTPLFSYQSSKPVPGVAKRKTELQGFPLQGKAKLAAARSCRQPWVSPAGTAGQRGHGAWERTDHVPFKIFPPSSTRSTPRHKPLHSRLCLWGNIPRGRGPQGPRSSFSFPSASWWRSRGTCGPWQRFLPKQSEHNKTLPSIRAAEAGRC